MKIALVGSSDTGKEQLAGYLYHKGYYFADPFNKLIEEAGQHFGLSSAQLKQHSSDFRTYVTEFARLKLKYVNKLYFVEMAWDDAFFNSESMSKIVSMFGTLTEDEYNFLKDKGFNIICVGEGVGDFVIPAEGDIQNVLADILEKHDKKPKLEDW